ncbi:MAG: hypothetical protein IJ642_07205 [Oscillospiraceae bacterium]|nr:hypothetical protein [Oscillospiraceae bacterium]
MKKIVYLIYSILFFAVCAVPGAMLLKQSDDDGSDEKRQLAEMPAFRTEEGEVNKNWSSEFQAYVSDHFGFRKNLVSIDSHLKADLLHVSAEDDVIIGKDGWLFYTPTVNDYLGRTTVSELGMQNIRHNLEMMKEFTEQQGSQFVLAIVPNKNTIYQNDMPDNYQNQGTSGNLAVLEYLLSESPVLEDYAYLPYVLWNEALAREPDILYHKLDTHWNNLGALIGYRAMMNASGLEYNSYSDAEAHIEQNWEGDLQKMLFPDSDILDDNYSYNIDFNYTYQGRYRDSDDITINTENPSGTGSLLMFRDSFGAAVIPYFSQNFQTAQYSRARPNPLYPIETAHFDLVILEIVERNIAWLQKEAPVHSALKADSVPQTDVSGSAEMFAKPNGSSYLQLYGTAELPENLETAPEYIVTLTDQDQNQLSYRAYNCYEADKLESDQILDNGWSLYIPAADLEESANYTVSLTIILPDSCLSCELGEIPEV